MNKENRSTVTLGLCLLLLAVLFGAFGAHGLKSHLSSKAIETYQTGVTYQFFHGITLVLMGILGTILNKSLKKASLFFALGILLFSFHCYLYALTGIKILAMIVPFGGVSFLIGWAMAIIIVNKENK